MQAGIGSVMAPKCKAEAARRRKERQENVSMAFADYDIRQGWFPAEAHRGGVVREGHRKNGERGKRVESRTETGREAGYILVYFIDCPTSSSTFILIIYLHSL